MDKLFKMNFFIFIVFLFLSEICVLSAQTMDSGLRQELDEIKQNQRAIQKELSEIKALLSRLITPQPSPQQPPPQVNIKGIEFDIGDNPVITVRVR